MRSETTHENHHHKPTHRARKFEGAMDIAVVGGIVLLAIAMVVGLFTASGSISF